MASGVGPARLSALSVLVFGGRCTIGELAEACREGNSAIVDFDTSCFTGDYITGVREGYLEALEERRSDAQKQARRKTTPARLAS